jgi:DNA-binding transcriptional MerR regulator
MTTWRIGEVASACGLSEYEISMWISRGLFQPSMSTRKGQWRRYDWRDVVCLAVAQELRKLTRDTGTALHLASGALREHLAARESLPPAPFYCLACGSEHEHRAEFASVDCFGHAFAIHDVRAMLVVDIATIGWAALQRLDAGRATEAA